MTPAPLLAYLREHQGEFFAAAVPAVSWSALERILRAERRSWLAVPYSRGNAREDEVWLVASGPPCWDRVTRLAGSEAARRAALFLNLRTRDEIIGSADWLALLQAHSGSRRGARNAMLTPSEVR